ncbi:MAG: hypothetical protein IPF73_10155 [Betaproteobacteria bacterium]|nr:hypothetical protein [Betaproteobacteria bacterium]
MDLSCWKRFRVAGTCENLSPEELAAFSRLLDSDRIMIFGIGSAVEENRRTHL